MQNELWDTSSSSNDGFFFFFFFASFVHFYFDPGTTRVRLRLHFRAFRLISERTISSVHISNMSALFLVERGVASSSAESICIALYVYLRLLVSYNTFFFVLLRLFSRCPNTFLLDLGGVPFIKEQKKGKYSALSSSNSVASKCKNTIAT